jgi:hypothetical protein
VVGNCGVIQETDVRYYGLSVWNRSRSETNTEITNHLTEFYS